MKAVAKLKPGPGIEVIDAPMPEVKPGWALVRVEYSAICGTDLHRWRWDTQAHGPKILGTEFPRILGHEGVGVVANVGEGVTRVEVGDRVVPDTFSRCGFCHYCRMGKSNLCEFKTYIGRQYDGCMAEYVSVPDHTLYQIPDSISFDEGALLEVFVVGVYGVEVSHLKLGDDVVVIGPGAIGLMQAIAAKAAGAAKVIVTGLGIDEKRLEMAANLGFATVNVDKENAENKVKQMTGGRGADVVFECATGVLSQAVSLVRSGGEIVLAAPGKPTSIDPSELLHRELTLTNHKAHHPSSWRRAINLVATKTVNISSMVDYIMPIAEAPKAFQMQADRAATKILLKP